MQILQVLEQLRQLVQKQTALHSKNRKRTVNLSADSAAQYAGGLITVRGYEGQNKRRHMRDQKALSGDVGIATGTVALLSVKSQPYSLVLFLVNTPLSHDILPSSSHVISMWNVHVRRWGRQSDNSWGFPSNAVWEEHYRALYFQQLRRWRCIPCSKKTMAKLAIVSVCAPSGNFHAKLSRRNSHLSIASPCFLSKRHR